MRTTEIQNEIANLTERRVKLQLELETAQDILGRAHDELEDVGKTSLDALTAAQARVTALTEAVARLGTRLEMLGEEFQQAAGVEAEAVATERILSDIEPESEAAAAELEEIDRQRAAFLRSNRERRAAAYQTIVALQNDFLSQLDVLAPGFRRFNRSPEDDATVQAVMSDLEQRGFVGRIVRFSNWQNYAIPGVTSFNSYQLPNLGEQLETDELGEDLRTDDEQPAEEPEQPAELQALDNELPDDVLAQLRIMSALMAAGTNGLTMTQIGDLFSRNRSSAELRSILDSLISSNRVTSFEERTSGRPKEVFRVKAVNEISRKPDAENVDFDTPN